jgi:hypothetical protein
MLPTRWVKISTYLQSEPFLSVIFILNNLKLLTLFVHIPNVSVLCSFYLSCSCYQSSSSFVCLLRCINVFSSSACL